MLAKYISDQCSRLWPFDSLFALFAWCCLIPRGVKIEGNLWCKLAASLPHTISSKVKYHLYAQNTKYQKVLMNIHRKTQYLQHLTGSGWRSPGGGRWRPLWQRVPPDISNRLTIILGFLLYLSGYQLCWTVSLKDVGNVDYHMYNNNFTIIKLLLNSHWQWHFPTFPAWLLPSCKSQGGDQSQRTRQMTLWLQYAHFDWNHCRMNEREHKSFQLAFRLLPLMHLKTMYHPNFL